MFKKNSVFNRECFFILFTVGLNFERKGLLYVKDCDMTLGQEVRKVKCLCLGIIS